ncbi:MAG: APC family permease [Planctomycetota bacterium]|nr:APC family permease [Planctomycetota bacterium]
MSIDFFSLVCLVVANMIGSGLYTSSGFALSSLGRADLVMWVWVIAGVMALCGAVSYGAIAKRLPDSGGEYLYLSRLIHPSVGFLAGWISLVAGFTGPLAAAALVFAVYADATALNRWNLDQKLIASIVIIVATLVHAMRLRTGLWTQNIAVVIKIAGLGILIVWGLSEVGLSPTHSGVIPITASVNATPFLIALSMLSSLVWISLSYTGFNAAVYVAGESKNAKAMVPIAMLTATILVTAIYLCLNYLFLFGCSPESIAGEPRIAEVAASAIGGPWMSRLMTATILLSSWTSVLSLLMTGPRVYAKMADDRLLPRLFQHSNNVPRVAIFVQAVLSIAVVYAANLRDLIGFLGLTLTACGAMTIASMWRIHRVLPDAPLLKWYEHLTSAVFIGLTCSMILVASTFQVAQFYTMLATFASGLLLYYLSRKFMPKRQEDKPAVEWSTE